MKNSRRDTLTYFIMIINILTTVENCCVNKNIFNVIVADYKYRQVEIFIQSLCQCTQCVFYGIESITVILVTVVAVHSRYDH